MCCPCQLEGPSRGCSALDQRPPHQGGWSHGPGVRPPPMSLRSWGIDGGMVWSGSGASAMLRDQKPYRRLPTGTEVLSYEDALQLLLLSSSRRPPRAPAPLPKSLAARWRLPPRLRHRGDRLHRSRHVKARLLTCGTPRRMRPCARTLILAGSGKRQPSFCERGKPGPPVHMSARRCIAIVKARFHHRMNRSSNLGGRWASHRMHQSSCRSLSDSVQQMLPFSKSSRGSACGRCSSRDVALKPR